MLKRALPPRRPSPRRSSPSKASRATPHKAELQKDQQTIAGAISTAADLRKAARETLELGKLGDDIASGALIGSACGSLGFAAGYIVGTKIALWLAISVAITGFLSAIAGGVGALALGIYLWRGKPLNGLYRQLKEQDIQTRLAQGQLDTTRIRLAEQKMLREERDQEADALIKIAKKAGIQVPTATTDLIQARFSKLFQEENSVTQSLAFVTPVEQIDVVSTSSAVHTTPPKTYIEVETTQQPEVIAQKTGQ